MGKKIKQLGKGVLASAGGPGHLVAAGLEKVGIKLPKPLVTATTLGTKREDIPGLGNLLFAPKPPESPDIDSILASAPPAPSPLSSQSSRAPGQTGAIQDDSGPTPTQRSRRARQLARRNRRGTETVLTGALGASQSPGNIFQTLLGG